MNKNDLIEINKRLKEIETKPISFNEDEEKNFKGKNIMTYGTFDLFHIGHQKIIDHCIQITGDQKNVYIGVSSDNWNKLKGKDSAQSETERIANIKKIFPRINCFLEDHDDFEKDWDKDWDKFSIDLLIMGGDHVKNLDYINNRITNSNKKMKIAFYERTPEISSTLLRKMEDEKKGTN